MEELKSRDRRFRWKLQRTKILTACICSHVITSFLGGKSYSLVAGESCFEVNFANTYFLFISCNILNKLKMCKSDFISMSAIVGGQITRYEAATVTPVPPPAAVVGDECGCVFDVGIFDRLEFRIWDIPNWYRIGFLKD